MTHLSKYESNQVGHGNYFGICINALRTSKKGKENLPLRALTLGLIILISILFNGCSIKKIDMNLFLSAYRFNTPMSEVIRSVLPILIVLFVGVLLISYVPFLTTALPHFFQAMGR